MKPFVGARQKRHGGPSRFLLPRPYPRGTFSRLRRCAVSAWAIMGKCIRDPSLRPNTTSRCCSVNTGHRISVQDDIPQPSLTMPPPNRFFGRQKGGGERLIPTIGFPQKTNQNECTRRIRRRGRIRRRARACRCAGGWRRRTGLAGAGARRRLPWSRRSPRRDRRGRRRAGRAGPRAAR